jgi:hypothetical protein
MVSTLVVLAALAIPLVFFILAFVVGCFERLAVRMFEAAPLEQLPSYVMAIVQDAVNSGFVLRTTGWHTKHRHKLVAVLMLSADTRILATASEGTIIGLPSKNTKLLTRFKDESVLLTTDMTGTGELDPKTTRQIVMNADFGELLRMHLARLNQRNDVLDFAADSDWSAVDEIYRKRIDRMVAGGLARYVDESREFYTYSIWGSFRTSIVNGIRQVLRPSNHLRQLKSRPG